MIHNQTNHSLGFYASDRLLSDNILLTSTGLSSTEATAWLNGRMCTLKYRPEDTPVYIVTTAANGNCDHKYIRLAVEQFRQLGFSRVYCIDIRDEPLPRVIDMGILYIAGGNTYMLFSAAQKARLDAWLETMPGWLYIGVSAGAIILGRSLLPAAFVGDDPGDLYKHDEPAFRLINADIFVHYNEDLASKICKNRIRRPIVHIGDGQSLDLTQAIRLSARNVSPAQNLEGG